LYRPMPGMAPTKLDFEQFPSDIYCAETVLKEFDGAS
jgi:hypothetical protein